MGRYSTGSETTEASTRLELKYLLEKGFFRKGSIAKGVIKWTDGSSISIKTIRSSSQIIMTLSYTITNDSGTTKINDLFEVTSVPSNLGKGEVLYFVCPETKKRARILYMAYGSYHFKSRDAYKHRIYYPSQVCGKKYRFPFKYFDKEQELHEIWKRGYKKTYKGKPTKIALKQRELLEYVSGIDIEPFYYI